MGKIAFVFSGQGAHHAGMGEDFYNNSESVKKLFDTAEEYRKGTLDQCFNGSAEVLKRTENTQPCLYLADIASAMYLDEKGLKADAVAGFSLGELPALAYAGAFSPEEGFKITAKRGELMGKAADKTDAAMVAVLKLPNEDVESLCSKYGHVYPVNYNSPGQLVVSGKTDELELFKADAKAAGGRVVPLAVGGGFHSPFMDEASKGFGEFLKTADVNKPKLTAYSNFTASPYGDNPKELLEKQINNPVKWEITVRKLWDEGFDTFIETGVGTTLTKLISKILPEAKCYAVENCRQAESVLKELGKDA
ncbi:MAG: ACP S-malonyltransferase [Oscillospiraceae bacterium]